MNEMTQVPFNPIVKLFVISVILPCNIIGCYKMALHLFVSFSFFFAFNNKKVFLLCTKDVNIQNTLMIRKKNKKFFKSSVVV